MSEAKEKLVCGIVMPISTCDGCTESHWSDILEILNESIEEAGFESKLVSNADDVGIIHKRIIQNLYDNPIVVCDVSGKNPNVMFELGLRLAFDKPTVIIKDDKTSYSFDTSGIEHLEYPRDLRFATIVEFKAKLCQKIKATHQKSIDDPAYSTFLKNFGEFTVAKLEKKEVSGQEFILEELKNLRQSIQRMEVYPAFRNSDVPSRLRNINKRNEFDVCLGSWSENRISQTLRDLGNRKDIVGFSIDDRKDGHRHLSITPSPDANLQELDLLLGKHALPKRPFHTDINEKTNKSSVIL